MVHVVHVVCLCLLVLQQVAFTKCQNIEKDSCKSTETKVEEDIVIKMKQLYAAFDRHRLETNTKIETVEIELQKTNDRLAESQERIAQPGKCP